MNKEGDDDNLFPRLRFHFIYKMKANGRNEFRFRLDFLFP